MKVRVCIRTRPTQNFAQDNLGVDIEHGTIRVKYDDDKDAASSVLNNRQNTYSFKFDYVFHNASQVAVYDLYARDCVHGVVNGVNGAIMSYGQTGSGKTFTMIGDAQSYEHRGIAPRAISQLFAEIASRTETEYMVSCTFMEIYNERIYDLLSDLSNPGIAADYTIAEDRDGRGVFVRGLAEIEVRDEHAALNLLFSGGLSRTVASHKLNKRSNRSHSIFTLYVQQRQRSGVSERVVHSKLHLIDLAGSERLKKTMDSMDGTIGDEVSRKESMAINQSLTFLEQCVVALGRKGGATAHVPFRQSKLTNILKDCLGANCNTVMIACIWGEASHLEETVSTLRLASRMMRVTNETSSVETVDTAILVKKQEKIIAALKQELLMHDALVERTGMVYDPYTPEQQADISDLIERYMEASEREEESVLNIQSYRQMLEICRQFKKKLLEARRGQAASRVGGSIRGSTSRVGSQEISDGVQASLDSDAGYLREGRGPQQGFRIDNNRGFALGEARADNRPTTGIEHATSFLSRPAGASLQPSSMEDNRAASPLLTPSPRRRNGGNRSMGMEGFGGDDPSVLESFVKEDDTGRKLFNDFLASKQSLKDLKIKVRQLSVAVNEAKSSIDQNTQTLEAKKQARVQEASKAKGKTKANADIVDEEEFRIAKLLKEAKQSYRNNFEQMQKLQNSGDMLANEIQDLRNKLAEGYERWQKGMSSPLSKRMAPKSPRDDMGGGGDELDDQEAFDRLETERVMANDPDSLAFFTAQKTMRANLTQSGTTIRMMQRNKRYG
eukprot:scaffold601_cov170-Ochromonas_danica.AAC.2